MIHNYRQTSDIYNKPVNFKFVTPNNFLLKLVQPCAQDI